MMLLLPHTLVLLLAAPLLSSSSWVRIPAESTWAIIAWGFPNGGKDTTRGRLVVDLDLDSQKDQIPALHAAGHITMCYFSTGTIEPFRKDCKENQAAWTAVAAGKMAGWDESWLDITKLSVRTVMVTRMVTRVCGGPFPPSRVFALWRSGCVEGAERACVWSECYVCGACGPPLATAAI